MEPNGFIIYFNRGITCALSTSGHKQYPPKVWIKIIQIMVFIEYPHEGIAFLLGFVKAMQYPSRTFEICYGTQRIYNIP
jgi:hypothetical protein